MANHLNDQVHPCGLHPRIVQKVVQRRGRLHAFEGLEPHRTALVVIDLMAASVQNDQACLQLVAPINVLAEQLRKAGGTIAWVTAAPGKPSTHIADIVGLERANEFVDNAQISNPASRLWAGLKVKMEDLCVEKQGFSAFFPGKCDLHAQLNGRGIENILIAGTVTNVCCESSARDAVELGYRVTMLADAMVGHSFGLHEASLNTFYRIFGDVRPVSDILDMIEAYGVD